MPGSTSTGNPPRPQMQFNIPGMPRASVQIGGFPPGVAEMFPGRIPFIPGKCVAVLIRNKCSYVFSFDCSKRYWYCFTIALIFTKTLNIFKTGILKTGFITLRRQYLNNIVLLNVIEAFL